MTGSSVDHVDVGAYALGVLNDWEASQFEIHLAECDTCAHELEELTLVSGLLSHVDGNSISVVEEYGRDGRAFDRMLNVVSMERRRERSRKVMSMAAAFVLVVGGIAYGLFGASPFADKPDSGVEATRTPGASLVIKGFDAQATDPDTGVFAGVKLTENPWGTETQLQLSKLKGPLTCELVAFATDGSEHTVLTWQVPEAGYGASMDKADALNISGATALKKADIAKFEVRVVKGSTEKNPLVTLPLAN